MLVVTGCWWFRGGVLVKRVEVLVVKKVEVGIVVGRLRWV